MVEYNKAELGKTAKELGFVRDTLEKVLRPSLKEIMDYFEQLQDEINSLGQWIRLER